MFRVGKVTHYYDKIGVAIVELDGTLAVNDHVKFMRDGEEIFDQNIESIQIGHDKVSSATKGQIVGIKTEIIITRGAELFKL